MSCVPSDAITDGGMDRESKNDHSKAMPPSGVVG